MGTKDKVVSRLTGEHLIEDAHMHYENVKINGEWVFMSLEKLIGMRIKGEIIKKRTRTWLE